MSVVRQCRKEQFQCGFSYLANPLHISAHTVDVVPEVMEVVLKLRPLFDDTILHFKVRVQCKMERLHVLAHLGPLSLESLMLLGCVGHDIGCFHDRLEHELQFFDHIV